LGLPFHLESVDVRALGDNLEQAAREARHGFFRRFLESGRLDRVALGHTLSDQAETVVFRFLRGAGTAGLSGIRPVTTDGLVRPLLDVPRADVERYLRERGIAWREDSTNADPVFARNRIRHSLLPQLTAEWNPALPQVLAQTAEWARAEEAYWQAELDRVSEGRLRRQGPAVILEREWLLSLPLAAARRTVRRVIEEVKGDLRSIDFAHVEAILALAAGGEGHGRLQAPGVDAMRSFEWLRLAPIGLMTLENRNWRLPLPVPGRVRLPTGLEIVTEIVENSSLTAVLNSVYNGSVGRLDWERISGTLDVRNWRPGDQYQPCGCSGQESIKSLFQQARVPLWERRYWPVVTSGDVIVWSRRFGPAAQFAAEPGTRKVLTICSEGELSG
jgi:tRNA(Ile)-lysidine synthase